jgi:O-antigen ligase
MHWILFGYMWLYIHRPFEIWPALGVLQVERVYMLLAIAAWLVYPHKRWLPNGLHWAFLAFASVTFLCWVNSPWSDVGYQTVEDYAKVTVFYLLLVTAIRDEADLRKFLLAFLAIMAVYMGHSLWEYLNGRHMFRMGIVRMIGMGVSMSDPNTFSASILYSLPLVVPVWVAFRHALARLFLVGYVPLAVLCILLTGSRSAFVGLLAFFVFTMAFNARRWRWAVLALPLVPLVWVAMPAALQNRFTTLVDPSVGPANAQQSAGGRLWGFQRGLDLLSRSPITGVGPGAFAVAARAGHQSHNLYGQVAGEMGTLGILAFAGLVGCFAYNAVSVRRLYEYDGLAPDFPYHVVQAISIAVLLLLLMGWGGHNLFRFTWLWFGAFEVVAVSCARANVWTAREEHLEKGLSSDEAADAAWATHPDGPALAGWWDPDPHPV